MRAVLPVSEVARHFLEYVNRVALHRERLLLVRDDQQPIAELRPVQPEIRVRDLPALFARLPHLDSDDVASFADDVQAGRDALARIPIRNHWDD